MKRCPTCQRTFEDTFTFCLVDGSILSPPFDPDAIKQASGAHGDNAPPTEVLPSGSRRSPESLAQTLVSPDITYTAPAKAPAAKKSEAAEIAEATDSLKRSGLPFVVGALLLSGIFFVILGSASGEEIITKLGIFLFAGGVIALVVTSVVKGSAGSGK
jgi:hypothetical protein